MMKTDIGVKMLEDRALGAKQVLVHRVVIRGPYEFEYADSRNIFLFIDLKDLRLSLGFYEQTNCNFVTSNYRYFF